MHRWQFTLLLLILLSLGACEINRLKNAEELYEKKRFAATIQEVDEYLPISRNGALATRAELLRSSSYYELGVLAQKRDNIDVAIRFYKLSNSERADANLADIYRMLADRAKESAKHPEHLFYINAILREIPKSPYIPEMLARRISTLYEIYAERDLAWQDYMLLFDTYSNNSFELQARAQVKRFIRYKVDYAQELSSQEYYSDALAILFELTRYPVLDQDELNRLIADNYQAQAEMYIIAQDYIEADRHFRIALQYYPAKKVEIDQRLNSIASRFIDKGNSLLDARDFENALLHFQKTFDIIPDYEPALEAIDRLFTLRINIQKAAQLFLDGEKLEVAGKFADAQKLYNAAFQLDDKADYRSKALQMQNLMEAQKNPSAFAQRIIMEHRGGLIQRRISEIKNELSTKYKAEEIRDSGWKIMLSTGQNKYETRYDILTPQETFFFIWQVNLRDRAVIPLNKLSESLLK